MSHILRGHQRRWGHWAMTGLSPLGWGHWGHQTTMCLSLLIQGDDKVPRPLGTLGHEATMCLSPSSRGDDEVPVSLGDVRL